MWPGSYVTENEVKQVIMDMPVDRAPGPDGFSGLFYKVCWDIISQDFMAVMLELHRNKFLSFGLLNSSIITLLPKKECSLEVADFRPINLIHGVAKIFAKVLAVRLAPLLSALVSQVQSAFISRRSMHENFKFVHNTARELHRKKIPSVLMKIDISKAFDTLSWEFIIQILKRRGFGNRWCSWICGLLRTASSSVRVNGEISEPFSLGSGVRQGDSLSPALFILVMDVLQAMINWAAQNNLLSSLGLNSNVPRTSFFADDVVLFLRNCSSDMEVIAAILKLFGEASGLRINLQKSTVTCIRCDESSSAAVAQFFGCQSKLFPLQYLGLPLSIYRLKRQDVWPLIDKYSNKMKGWKPRLMAPARRLTLTQSVLMAFPIHFLSVMQLPAWALKIINRRCRGFLWKGNLDINGGHCLLPWS